MLQITKLFFYLGLVFIVVIAQIDAHLQFSLFYKDKTEHSIITRTTRKVRKNSKDEIDHLRRWTTTTIATTTTKPPITTTKYRSALARFPGGNRAFRSHTTTKHTTRAPKRRNSYPCFFNAVACY